MVDVVRVKIKPNYFVWVGHRWFIRWSKVKACYILIEIPEIPRKLVLRYDACPIELVNIHVVTRLSETSSKTNYSFNWSYWFIWFYNSIPFKSSHATCWGVCSTNHIADVFASVCSTITILEFLLLNCDLLINTTCLIYWIVVHSPNASSTANYINRNNLRATVIHYLHSCSCSPHVKWTPV